MGALHREQRPDVLSQSLNSSAWAGYLQFGHKIIPLPLSLGYSGNLKQKIHLKSSIDKFAAFGLYNLKFACFMVL
jgi:hypothetical protein